MNGVTLHSCVGPEPPQSVVSVRSIITQNFSQCLVISFRLAIKKRATYRSRPHFKGGGRGAKLVNYAPGRGFPGFSGDMIRIA
jgi:hypothetical protein